MNYELIKQLLVIAIAVSVITCAFIQKTKGMFKSSKVISVYSFIINMVFGVVYCLSFTEISILLSLWVGVFAFVGADSLYKSLEGKLKSYSDIIKKEDIVVIQRGE